MSRLWRQNPPIIVVVLSSELPSMFYWEGKSHPVSAISNHWIIERDWWRQAVERDYFLVTTGTGLWAEIFHDRLTDTWHLQRLYD